jgi:hypothetical protein
VYLCLFVILNFPANNLDINVDNYTLQQLFIQLSTYANKSVTFSESQSAKLKLAIDITYSTVFRTRSIIIQEEISFYTSKLMIIGKTLEFLKLTSSSLQSLNTSASANTNVTTLFMNNIEIYLQLLIQLGRFTTKIFIIYVEYPFK